MVNHVNTVFLRISKTKKDIQWRTNNNSSFCPTLDTLRRVGNRCYDMVRSCGYEYD